MRVAFIIVAGLSVSACSATYLAKRDCRPIEGTPQYASCYQERLVMHERAKAASRASAASMPYTPVQGALIDSATDTGLPMSKPGLGERMMQHSNPYGYPTRQTCTSVDFGTVTETSCR